jgi:hypothetical protein
LIEIKLEREIKRRDEGPKPARLTCGLALQMKSRPAAPGGFKSLT